MFSRQVNQADRDRDPVAVAVLEIDDFAEVNRRLDYEAGDDLLRAVGGALAAQASVDTVVARLGGARFGVLTVGRPAADPRRWVGPIVTSVKRAIGGWTFDQLDYLGQCAVEPELRVGVAGGRSGQVWGRAEAALELAGQPAGDPVVVHDPDDPRVAAAERRRAELDRLARALSSDRLTVAGHRIDPLAGTGPGWCWYRLGVVDPGAPATRLLDAGPLPAALQRRLEDRLVDQAGRILRAGDAQLRLTVPLGARIAAGDAFAARLFANLERLRVPPSRLVFELAERTLTEAGDPGRSFVRRLDRIGSGVIVADHRGGWSGWRAIEDLPVPHLKPCPDLVGRAAAGDPAARAILDTVVTTGLTSDRTLIAPAAASGTAALAGLGFTYREARRPAPVEAGSVPVGR